MKIISGILITIAILGLIVTGYLYSGIYNVAAHEKGGSLPERILKKTRERSINRRTALITLPASLNPVSLARGFKHYHEVCEQCHGGPGLGPTGLKRGLNPKPPDLYKPGGDLTPAVVFWTVKHGIKMSGMPSFGRTHDDRDLLPVVAFVNRLPGITKDEYGRLVQRYGDKGRYHRSELHIDGAARRKLALARAAAAHP